MTPEEFFIDKFNKCICVQLENEPRSIYMIHDEQFTRECKINSLLNLDEPIFKLSDKSILLFQQDYKHGYFWYDYNEIFLFFHDKYGLEYYKINNLIKDLLVNNDKLKSSTPKALTETFHRVLNKNDKLKSLTPHTPLRCLLAP